MRVAEFKLFDLVEQIEPLLPLHYAEIARNKHLMELSPDWPAYRGLDERGMLLCIGAWDDEDRLVGYSVTMIMQHVHYSGLTVGQNDVLFLLAEHRHNGLGLQLILLTEQLAAARGARLMLWHAKQGTDLDIALSRAGYPVQDIIYSKEL